MNKTLLSTVAAAALLVSSSAFAADSSTGNESQQQSNEAQQGLDPTQGTNVDGAETTADAPAEDKSTVFGSYRDSSMDFAGEVEGGHSADDLIDKDVVNAEGESIGEVSDLLISADNKVRKVLVDVGGILGIGSKTVALDVNALQFAQDSGDALLANMTEEDLKALPEYEKQDEGWKIR